MRRVFPDDLPDAAARLAGLGHRVATDLAATAHPRQPWLAPRSGPDGRHVHDVIIVGAGQSGLAIAFGLRRAKVENVVLLDRAEAGREGPWLTHARMATLRSPKDFTGPDLDQPSLTYQAWHEARFGEASWQALDLIGREHWAEYLCWFREVLVLPVRNGVEVVSIGPAADGGLLAVVTRCVSGSPLGDRTPPPRHAEERPKGASRSTHSRGASFETPAARAPQDDEGRSLLSSSPPRTETLLARKVVLATGQEGAGRWASLPELAGLPAHLKANTADPIDFVALAGRHVAVVGAGASALDNAATALEAGATVDLLCRRASPQVIQPYRWLTFAGFLRHLCDLDDAWRWRFMRKVMSLREGFPQPTWDRCARHAGFRLRGGTTILGARERDGRAVLETSTGPIAVDLVISATGIDTDFAARPELAGFAHNIATWADRYAPPTEERDDRLGAFPYLADDYAFTEKVAGATPWIADIHLFAIASTMSFGASGSSINAMTTAVPKLVSGLTRGLFRADVERHWTSFEAYDVPQAVLRRSADARPDGPLRAAGPPGQTGTGLARGGASGDRETAPTAHASPPDARTELS